MWKITKFICVATFTAMLIGCLTTTSYQQSLAHWNGTNIQSLIKSWGSPDAAMKTANGNTVYMFSREQLYTVPTQQMAPGTILHTGSGSTYASSFNEFFAPGGQTVSRYCRTWFEVNRQGIIINSRFQGSNCVA